MIVYHGTTRSRAQRIQATGFQPLKPSKRVWFTQRHGYARQRAKVQAKRHSDRPAVLMCDLNLAELRSMLGKGSVMTRSHVVVVRGSVPASFICSPAARAQTFPWMYTAAALAQWINQVLDLKPHNGVSPKHPGAARLEQWVRRRLADNPRAQIPPEELMALAQQWIPEHLATFRIEPGTLHAVRTIPQDDPGTTGSEGWIPPEVDKTSEQEEEALACLMSDKARRRARGIRMLAELDEPDLFEWCMMYFEDEDVTVRETVLRTMRTCQDAEPDLVEPLVDDDDKRIRAAAVGFMTRHGEDRAEWYRLGLTDPEPHVRVTTARYLEELDPEASRELFELALYDAQPVVAGVAKKLTAGKGYHVEQW